MAKAREYNDKAIDSALTAMYGYGIGIMASSLVANGLVRGSNEKKKKTTFSPPTLDEVKDYFTSK